MSIHKSVVNLPKCCFCCCYSCCLKDFIFLQKIFVFKPRKIIIWGKAGKIVCVCCVCMQWRERERKKLCDVDWRDDDDDGVLCVLEADGFSSFLLCSINDLDRDGLSNHNSSWYCPRWTWTYTHTIFNLISRLLLWLFDVVRGRCEIF